jgi:predicted PurR-regulated permease PerM
MNALQRSLLLLGLLLVLLLIYLLKPILAPFLIGLLIAYLGDPLVDKLEELKLHRSLAVGLVILVFMLAITGAVLVFMPMLVREIVEIVRQLPVFIEWLQINIGPFFLDRLGIDPFHVDLKLLKETLFANWQTAGGTVGVILTDITRSGVSLAAWLASVALVPVVSFYLLRDWDILMANIRELLPRLWVGTADHLAGECDEVLGAFLRGQLIIMALLGSIYALGLWLVGLEIALTIGLLAGLASLVPYLGFIIGLAAATLAALFQFQELMPLVYVFVVFLVGQMIEGMVLTPWLMGDRIGLHPVAIIFAVLAGGQLFGFVGVLLALPMAAVIMVFLRHIHELYKESDLYDAVEKDL